MLISTRWLGRHVDLSGVSPSELAEELTLSTCEVEGVEPFCPQLQAVKVANAATTFAADSDGTIAVDDWENALVSAGYVTPEDLQSLFDPNRGRWLAFNEKVGGLHVDDLERMPGLVLLFECPPGSPLAGGPELLARRRHAGTDGAIVVYADITSEFLPVERYGRLRWEP